MSRKIRSDSAKNEALRILFYVTACWATDLNIYLLTAFTSASQVSKAIKELREVGYITFLGKEEEQSKKVVMITEKGKIKYIDDHENDQYAYIHRNDYGQEYNNRRAKGELEKYFRNIRVVLMMEACSIKTLPFEKPSLEQLYCQLSKRDYAHQKDENGNLVIFPNSLYNTELKGKDCFNIMQQSGFYYTIREYRRFLKTIGGDTDAILGTVACGLFINAEKCLLVYRQSDDSRQLFKLSESDRRLVNSVDHYMGEISNFNRSIKTGGIQRGTVDAMVISNGNLMVPAMVMGAKAGKRTPESELAKRRRELREKKNSQTFEKVEAYTEITARVKGLNTKEDVERLKSLLLEISPIYKVTAEVGMQAVTMRARSGAEIDRKKIRSTIKENGFHFAGFKSERRTGTYMMNFANSIYNHIFIIPSTSTGLASMQYFLTTSAEQWRADGVALAERLDRAKVGESGFSMNAADNQESMWVANALRSHEVTTNDGKKTSVTENIRIVWLPVFEVKQLYQMSIDNSNSLYGIICFEGMEETFAHAIRKKCWFFRPEAEDNVVIDDQGDPVVDEDGEYQYYDKPTLKELNLPYLYDENGYRVDKPSTRKRKKDPKPKPRYHTSTVRFEVTEYNRLKLMAKQKGMSVGRLIRMVMKDYTDKNIQDWKYKKSKEPRMSKV